MKAFLKSHLNWAGARPSLSWAGCVYPRGHRALTVARLCLFLVIATLQQCSTTPAPAMNATYFKLYVPGVVSGYVSEVWLTNGCVASATISNRPGGGQIAILNLAANGGSSSITTNDVRGLIGAATNIPPSHLFAPNSGLLIATGSGTNVVVTNTVPFPFNTTNLTVVGDVAVSGKLILSNATIVGSSSPSNTWLIYIASVTSTDDTLVVHVGQDTIGVTLAADFDNGSLTAKFAHAYSPQDVFVNPLGDFLAGQNGRDQFGTPENTGSALVWENASESGAPVIFDGWTLTILVCTNPPCSCFPGGNISLGNGSGGSGIVNVGTNFSGSVSSSNLSFNATVDLVFTNWLVNGTAVVAAVLAPTGVSAGTLGDAYHFPNPTIDAKGRITAGGSISLSTYANTTNSNTFVSGTTNSVDWLIIRGGIFASNISFTVASLNATGGVTAGTFTGSGAGLFAVPFASITGVPNFITNGLTAAAWFNGTVTISNNASITSTLFAHVLQADSMTIGGTTTFSSLNGVTGAASLSWAAPTSSGSIETSGSGIILHQKNPTTSSVWENAVNLNDFMPAGTGNTSSNGVYVLPKFVTASNQNKLHLDFTTQSSIPQDAYFGFPLINLARGQDWGSATAAVIIVSGTSSTNPTNGGLPSVTLMDAFGNTYTTNNLIGNGTIGTGVYYFILTNSLGLCSNWTSNNLANGSYGCIGTNRPTIRIDASAVLNGTGAFWGVQFNVQEVR